MISVLNPTNKAAVVIFSIMAAVASWPVITNYFHVGVNISSFSLLLIPFILFVKEPGKINFRFGLLSLLFLTLYLFTEFPVILLLVFFTLFLFILEVFLGKLNNLAFMVVFFLAPMTAYFFKIAGFFIRLNLTEYAAFLIDLFAGPCTSEGNLITFKGANFTVEPECMGLNMVRTSFLFSLFYLALFQKNKKLNLPVHKLLLVQVLTFLLVILSNYLRIIAFVVLNIQPETILHEAGGLFFLLAVVIIPLYGIIKKVYQTETTPVTEQKTGVSKPFLKLIAVPLISIAIVTLFYCSYYKPVIKVCRGAGVNKALFKNFDYTTQAYNVQKFESDAAFIYVKPPVQFYRADHYPLICWKGSGYKVLKEEIREINGVPVGFASMSNGNDSYHTVWWYDNGQNKTANDLKWRWDNFTGGDDYSIINIASRHEHLLLEEAERLLNNKVII